MDFYYSGRSFGAYASDQAVSLGGLPGDPSRPRNDGYDAYRHALLNAKMTDHLGADTAKSIGDQHEREALAAASNETELKLRQIQKEVNMDLYNNDVGREEYFKWRDAKDRGDTNVSLEKWIYDAVKAGKTINDLNDPRQWVERPPSERSENTWPTDPMGNPAVSPSVGTTPDPKVKTVRYVDPLILDLDGDGLEITPLSKNILFDADGDTIKTGTAWAGADDGFVVWDRNGNGTIDKGAELFGDETILANGQKASNGFTALAEQDSNKDGKFDASDAQYANLRIWRDLNQDGISQTNELTGLAASGVKSISLTSNATNTNYGDAVLIQNGTYTRNDNSTGQAGSFILAQNSFNRQFTPITVSDAAKALPNIAGSGMVRDLQEAATLSPELIALLNQAKNSTTRAAYKDAVAALMREWGNDSAYNSASKQALAEGYGLIMSEPVDAQEIGWMQKAIKASEADRNAYRATLGANDLVKNNAANDATYLLYA